MQQGYDGDGLRAQKIENGTATYYLRSSVLGGKVVAEIDGSGNSSRGYIYAGGELLAVQQSNSVNWVHEDAVTKSKRVTDINGNIVSTVELDPWGGDTNRSANSAFQPQQFTSYVRDGNGGQDAMARRYATSSARFSQPDPYGGSYDFSDPQSLNRYAYAGNDPVNHRDPSGMMTSEFCGAEYSYVACGGNGGFWGGGSFGGQVAEYNHEYGGLPANIAGAMHLIDQRIGNARGGLGFLTSAEILEGARATDAHAYITYDGVTYDAGGVVWSSNSAFDFQRGSGTLLGAGYELNLLAYRLNPGGTTGMWRGSNGILYDMAHGANGATGSKLYTLEVASKLRVVGKVVGVAGIGISLIQGGQALQQGNRSGAAKAGLDATMGGVGTFGGPWGTAAAGAYFGIDMTVGWPRLMDQAVKHPIITGVPTTPLLRF